MGAEPHRLTLHETRTRCYVPACSCSWIGLTHADAFVQGAASANRDWHWHEARRAAEREHAAHVAAQRLPRVDRMNP